VNPIPHPLDEPSRLEALRAYGIVDAAPEPAFEDIVRLTARGLRAPIAIVGFVDETRHVFSSAVGTDLRQNARTQSFCTYTILQDNVFEVLDTLEDERFRHLPVVRDLGVRGYAGAPLVTPSGARIGSLCVFDYRPRAALRLEERLALQTIAAFVVRTLESRRAMFRTTERENVSVSSSLEPLPLYGRPSESAPAAALRIVSDPALTSQARLLARIRTASLAPTPAQLTRLSDDTAILVHDFGIAPTDQVWRIWTLGRNTAPRPLETFTAAITTLRLPDDAALVLLSQEPRDSFSSHPTQVLASGKLESSGFSS
jgi:hypothetical protein